MTLPVMTGRLAFGCTLTERAAQMRESVKARLGVDVPAMASVSTTAPLYARVNHNRWIVDCPDCNSAEYVWPEEPLMMCANCLNGAVGGQWRRVELPPDKDDIEMILKARPVPQSRNWEVPESLATLRSENRAHGLVEEVS